MFAGEVLIVFAILAVGRRISDAPPDKRPRLDLVGTGLSALGLGLVVFGILKAGSWGFVHPKPEAPTWLGLSPAIWLVIGGGVVMWIFFAWENRLLKRGGEPLVNPSILLNRTLRSGLTASRIPAPVHRPDRDGRGARRGGLVGDEICSLVGLPRTRWDRSIVQHAGMWRALDSAQSARGPIGSLSKLVGAAILNQRIVEMAGRHSASFSIPVPPELERRWTASGVFPRIDPELIHITQAERA